MVSTLLLNLKVSDLDTRDSEVRDLKFELNGNATILLSLFSLDGGESKRGSHEVFLPARELLDGPHHTVCVWHVLDVANVGLEDRGVDIRRHWHDNLNVVSNRFRFELSLSLHKILNLGPCEVLDRAISPD